MVKIEKSNWVEEAVINKKRKTTWTKRRKIIYLKKKIVEIFTLMISIDDKLI